MSIKNDIDTYILKNTRGGNLPDVRLNLNQYKALHDALGDIPHGWGPIRKVDTRPDLVGFKTIMYRGCQIILDPLAVHIDKEQL